MEHLRTIKEQNNVGKTHLSCFAHISLLLISMILFACSPNEQKIKSNENNASGNSVETKKVVVKSAEQVEVTHTVNYASVVDEPRTGIWLGGSPAVNKSAAEIDTYIRIVPASKQNHLLVALQFEGAKFDDAFISFKPLDGAEITERYPTKWLLKPHVISQVKFEVKVPKTVSYLTLYTFQNGKGAARAFILEKTKLKK